MYKYIEEMVIDMCLLCDELRNKGQEYDIIPSDEPLSNGYGFIIWWGVKHVPSGLAIEELSESFQIKILSLSLAEDLTKIIFKSKETREAFAHCLKNNNYPIEREKIEEIRESNRIVDKGW